MDLGAPKTYEVNILVVLLKDLNLFGPRRGMIELCTTSFHKKNALNYVQATVDRAREI
jgi:hypothetical protein